MKTAFLLLLLGFAAACSRDTPAPQPAPGPSVSYTDATGKTSAISSYRAFLVTPPPSSTGQERRVLVLRCTLPDASVLELLYYYVGTGVPAATGAVRLDEFVQAANYPASVGSGTYFGGSATGTLSVDSVVPAAVSGTFEGPMAVGGPRVKLVFQRVSL